MNNKTTALDTYDINILDILQKDCMMPQRDIGNLVNLSAAAVQRRIKRMREKGIIQATVAVVDPQKLHQPVTLLVEITLDSEQIELIDAAKKSFAEAPEIQQCYYVTGETDFILVVVTETMAAYEALTRKLFFNNPNIKRFNTFVTMDRVKVGIAIPLVNN
jgi:DNA-binding Lrp family transcriptional regulator